MDDRSRYYRTVAGRFLEYRGRPPILSPREIAVIRTWEEAGIPLRVVLDGMEAFFSARRGGKAGVPLTACASAVERAFAAYKARTVGRSGKTVSRSEKAALLEERIVRFLAGFPRELSCVRREFERALDAARKNPPDEDELERLEDAVEEKLKRLEAPGDDEEKDAPPRNAPEDPEERTRILELERVKALREKHGIPRLSLFYY